MESVELAEAVALRLREVVPSGYVVEARDGDVAIRVDDSAADWCAIGVRALMEQDGDPEDHIESACYSVLDTAQDMITEDTTSPWPPGVPTTPGVRIENGRVHLWYGDQETPVLTLRPIDLGAERLSTEDVVGRLQRERARLLRAVDALGPGASTTFVTEEGGWTASDVLAHLIHYAGQIVFALGAPERPPSYVIGVTERLGPQEWNERAVAYWREFPPAEVRSEFERVVDQVITFASRRTDDQMNATDAVPWAGEQPLWKFIGGDTFLYEWPAHSAQIESAAPD